MGALIEALFLDIGSLPFPRRFAVLRQPSSGNPAGLMVYVHPFAEEMNKARRMAALQASAMAEAGWVVLTLDQLGCGDSDGEFGDANWANWVDDVVAAATWLRQRFDSPHGQVLPLWLWGLRTGALLASQAAARIENTAGLLLWQPVGSGKQALQQFLRLKSAAAKISGASKGGTEDLREQLRAGASVDVAGYRLSPGIAEGLESATLSPPPGPMQVEWFEVGGGEPLGLSPAASVGAQRWRDVGHGVETHVVKGPPFWHSVEVEVAPDLLSATVARMSAVPDPARRATAASA